MKMGEDVLEEAVALYATGRSLRSVSRELIGRTTYTNPCSMAQALGRQFRKRGIPLRSPVVQTVMQGAKHVRLVQESPEVAAERLARIAAGLPERERCTGTTKAGERCRLPAELGSDVCWTHDPANADFIAARTAALHARRDAHLKALP